MFLKIISIYLSYVSGIILKLQGNLKFRALFNTEYKRSYKRDAYLFAFSRSITEYAIRYPEKIKELKRNLDQQSVELIENILKRVHYIYTHNILKMSELISPREVLEHGETIRDMVRDTEFLKIPDNNFDVTVFYYKHGLIYIPRVLTERLKNKDFIDGGAYNGDSALMFEKFYQPNQIFSFEPNLRNYNLMLKTIKLNNLKKVKPIKMALGKAEGSLNIIDKGSATTISKDGERVAKIISIDEFCIQNNLSVGLIKLDLEGHGLEALKGAENTLKRFKPILLLSIYHSGEEFFEIKSYLEGLNLNYRLIIRKLAAPRPFYDTNLIAWIEN